MATKTLNELGSAHARCKQLVRQRSKLTGEEQEYLDLHLDEVMGAVHTAFNEMTSNGRALIKTMWGKINVASAINELTKINPRITTIGDPLQTIQTIAELDGMDAVAFETAREAMALRTLIESQMTLWAAWWDCNGVASSQDALDSQFKSTILDIMAIKADLSVFLTFYEVTMRRVAAVYEKVSRVITVLSTPAWSAPQLPVYNTQEAPIMEAEPDDLEDL